MITDALTGYVLHQRATGNSSAQVTFFTREKGLVRARFQGARSAKNQAILQRFTPLWLVFDERNYGMYVRQVEMSAMPPCITGHAMFSGLYINELLYHAQRPQEAEPLLFDAYAQALNDLVRTDTPKALEMALRRLEWVLLETSGTHVSYAHEIDVRLPLVAEKHYGFLPGEGFFEATKGYPGAHLLAMAEGEFGAVDGLKTAKQVFRRAIDYLLDGKPIHSRALYRAALDRA